MFLILTSDQADALRGPTAPGAELAPVLLADGETWVLPAQVLDDPAHVARRAQLDALPRRAVAAEDFPLPVLPGA